MNKEKRCIGNKCRYNHFLYLQSRCTPSMLLKLFKTQAFLYNRQLMTDISPGQHSISGINLIYYPIQSFWNQ
jgi:hypothetical protein